MNQWRVEIAAEAAELRRLRWAAREAHWAADSEAGANFGPEQLPHDTIRQIATRMRNMRVLWNNVRLAQREHDKQAKIARARAKLNNPNSDSDPADAAADADNDADNDVWQSSLERADHLSPSSMGDLINSVTWLTHIDHRLPAGGQAVLPESLRIQLQLPEPALDYAPFYARSTALHESMPFLPVMVRTLRQELLPYLRRAGQHLQNALRLQQEAQAHLRQVSDEAAAAAKSSAEQQQLEEEEAEEKAEEDARRMEEGATDASAEAEQTEAQPPQQPPPQQSAEADSATDADVTPNGASDDAIFDPFAIDPAVAAIAVGTAVSAPSSSSTSLSLAPSPLSSATFAARSRHVYLERLVWSYSLLAHDGMRLAYRLHDVELAAAMLDLSRRCVECAATNPPYRRLLERMQQRGVVADADAWLDSVVREEDFFEDAWGNAAASMHAPVWERRCDEFLLARQASMGRFRSDALRVRAANALAFVAVQKLHLAAAITDYLRLLQLHVIQLPDKNSVRTGSGSGAKAKAVPVPLPLRMTADACLHWWRVARANHLPLFARHYGCLGGVASSTQALLIEHMRRADEWRGTSGLHLRLPAGYRPDKIADHPPVIDDAGLYHKHEQAQLDLLQFFPSAARHTPESVAAMRALPAQQLVDRMTDDLEAMMDHMRAQLEAYLQRNRQAQAAVEEAAVEARDRQAQADSRRTLPSPFGAAASSSASLPNFALSLHSPTAAPRNEWDVPSTGASADGGGDWSGEVDEWQPTRRVNSTVMLRFLRPLVLAAVRSGRVELAMQAIQLTSRCGLTPGFKLLSAATFMLSEEQLRLQLNIMGWHANTYAHVDGHTLPRRRNDTSSLRLFNPADHLPPLVDAEPHYPSVRLLSRWAQSMQFDWPLTYDTVTMLVRMHTDIVSWAHYARIIIDKEAKMRDRAATHAQTGAAAEAAADADGPTHSPVVVRGFQRADGSPVTLHIPFSVGELQTHINSSVSCFIALIRLLHSSDEYFRIEERAPEHQALRPYDLRLLREEVRRKRAIVASAAKMARSKRTPRLDAEVAAYESERGVVFEADGVTPATLQQDQLPELTPDVIRAASIPLLQQWIASGVRGGGSGTMRGFHHSGWKHRVFRMVTLALTPLLQAVEDGAQLFTLIQEVMALHLDVPDTVFQHATHALMHKEEARLLAMRAKHAGQAAAPPKRKSKRGKPRYASAETVRKQLAAEESLLHDDLDHAGVLELLEREEAANSAAPSSSPSSSAAPEAQAHEPYTPKHASKVAWLLLTMCDLGIRPSMGSLEWAHGYLASSPTLADQFYLQCLQQRLLRMHFRPTRAVYHAHLLAEVSKRALVDAMLKRPLATVKPPTAFSTQAAADAAVTSTLEEAAHQSHQHLAIAGGGDGGGGVVAQERSTFAAEAARLRIPQHQLDVMRQHVAAAGVGVGAGHPGGVVLPFGSPYAYHPPSSLEGALQQHTHQWEWVLRQSSLIPEQARRGSSSASPLPQSASLSAISFSSNRTRGGPFFAWLGSTLSTDPEHILAIIDSMKRENVRPDLECFNTAMEACVQLCTPNAAAARLKDPSAATLVALMAQATAATGGVSQGPSRGLHYALLLLSDMRSLGVQPDVVCANSLLYIFLCNGAHQLVQELLAGSTIGQLGVTMLGDGPRCVVQTGPPPAELQRDGVDPASLPTPLRLCRPLSLPSEIALLERVLASLDHEPPPYEVGLADSNEELEEPEGDAARALARPPVGTAAAAAAGGGRTLQMTPAQLQHSRHAEAVASCTPLFVRADDVTLAVLEGGQASMDYPPNQVAFMRQLQTRKQLRLQIAKLEAEWNDKLRQQHVQQHGEDDNTFKPRTWKKQIQPTKQTQQQQQSRRA